MEGDEVVQVDEFEDLDVDLQREVAAAYMLGEKIRRLIVEEGKAGQVSHEAAWNAALNIVGWLTMSFGDPRREAAQAAEMLVQGIDANLTARSKTKN